MTQNEWNDEYLGIELTSVISPKRSVRMRTPLLFFCGINNGSDQGYAWTF